MEINLKRQDGTKAVEKTKVETMKRIEKMENRAIENREDEMEKYAKSIQLVNQEDHRLDKSDHERTRER